MFGNIIKERVFDTKMGKIKKTAQISPPGMSAQLQERIQVFKNYGLITGYQKRLISLSSSIFMS